MFLANGRYDRERHHESHLAVGVPGTVGGLHAAWVDNGRLPWKRLLQPAIALAREGFMVSDGLARGLRAELPRLKRYPASLAQFSRAGVPYEMGDLLQQEDLARTLERIAEKGARGLLRGRDGAPDREGDEGARRPDHARGPRSATRVYRAAAAARDLPRLRGAHGAAAELRRHRACWSA